MFQTEIIPQQAFKQILDCKHLIFDIDRTLADVHSGIPMESCQELAKLPMSIGVATARSLSELEAALPDGLKLGDVFNGDILLEDGSTLVKGGQNRRELLKVNSLIDLKLVEAVGQLKSEVIQALAPAHSDSEGWQTLANISSPLVKLPPFNDFLTSLTLWEKGTVGNSDFIKIQKWCEAKILALGLDQQLVATEIGDGTLRITIPGMSKGWGLEKLQRDGRLDLASCAYFGDGRNDVPAAEVIKANGGIVIAAAKTCPELVALADYAISIEGPAGMMSMLKQLNRLF